LRRSPKEPRAQTLKNANRACHRIQDPSSPRRIAAKDDARSSTFISEWSIQFFLTLLTPFNFATASLAFATKDKIEVRSHELKGTIKEAIGKATC
jgi:hypothetical protein